LFTTNITYFQVLFRPPYFSLSHNFRQVLKHARSKNLHKNSITFFQAKSAVYESKYQLEPTTLLFEEENLGIDTAEFPENITSNTEESTISDSIVIEESLPIDAINSENPTSVTKTTSTTPTIRGNISSPWLRR